MMRMISEQQKEELSSLNPCGAKTFTCTHLQIWNYDGLKLLLERVCVCVPSAWVCSLGRAPAFKRCSQKSLFSLNICRRNFNPKEDLLRKKHNVLFITFKTHQITLRLCTRPF